MYEGKDLVFETSIPTSSLIIFVLSSLCFVDEIFQFDFVDFAR